MIRAMKVAALRACGLMAMVAGLSAVCFANAPIPAPEIDAGSMASALALLSGGVLMLKGRRRR
jgi:hypothetical protein